MHTKLPWRAGPLAFDIAAFPPPPDWACGAPAEASCAWSVDARARVLPAVGGGEVIASIDGDSGTLHRAGGFESFVDFGARTARYEGLCDVDGDAQSPIFESFLRVISSGALLRRGGALLHASAVARAGKAYVFCGVSGAGKTTLVEGTADAGTSSAEAREPQAIAYLTDDQSIVTALSSPASSHAFSAWGTPFSGSARRRAPPVERPIAAFVLLSPERPSATSLLRRRDRAGAAAEILRHVCAHEQTKSEASRALAFAARAASTTSIFVLARHIDTPLAAILDQIDAQIEGAQIEGARADHHHHATDHLGRAA